MVDLGGLPERVLMDWFNRRWSRLGQIRLQTDEPSIGLDAMATELGEQPEDRHPNLYLAVHHGGGFPLLRLHVKPRR